MAAVRFDIPTPDLETQPFWDGCREGVFLVRHCNTCGEDHLYPADLFAAIELPRELAKVLMTASS